MHIVLTRPADDASDWEIGLRAAGHNVLLLPLITIGLAPDPSELRKCWAQMSDFNVLMFVSANAVKQFFAAQPAGEGFEAPGLLKGPWRWPHLRLWATGPGTTRALLAHGVPLPLINMPPHDARAFDSEALWQQVQGQIRVDARVLIVRGVSTSNGELSSQGTGRDWLADRVRAVGGRVEFCVAYQRSMPIFSENQRVAVQQWINSGAIWLFSSSEAIAHLVKGVSGIDWKQARALCTHPRIAITARACGFGVVQESRPTLSDVMASIESSA